MTQFYIIFAVIFLAVGCQEKDFDGKQIDESLQFFVLENPEEIGTWNDLTFYEGGFSGLYYIPNTTYEFILINDRGPNFPIEDDALTSGKEIKLFPFPTYTQKLVHVRARNGKLEILSSQPLVFASGEKLSGIPYPAAYSTHEEIAWRGLNKEIIPPSEYGADIEGLTFVNDSILWFCEEYRPSLWQINLNSMQRVNVFTPGDGSLPEILSKRSPNRGFEGLTQANGKIYAMLQSPLRNPDKTIGNQTRLNRIIELNTMTGEVNTFVYEMNNTRGALQQKDWKIGDITYYKDHQFLVLEHGQRDNEHYIELYLIDLSQATPVSNQHPKHDILETYLNATNLEQQAKLRTVSKKLVLDVLAAGYDSKLGKPEGISLVSPSLIALLNDNDYGITESTVPVELHVTNKPTTISFFPISLD
jgi:hypothetical protein